MIFIDGEEWPPSLHGTGTEDYFNTAYCPQQEYSAPYHGITLGGADNWGGHLSLYRFHVEDPSRSNAPSGSPSSTATPTSAQTTSPRSPTGTRPNRTGPSPSSPSNSASLEGISNSPLPTPRSEATLHPDAPRSRLPRSALVGTLPGPPAARCSRYRRAALRRPRSSPV